MPFLAVMFYMMIIGFIMPLRPTISISEKRYLDKFPTFSFNALISGSYTEDISHWFADTFPGREVWLEINRIKESMHGFNFNYVDVTQLEQSDEIPVVSSETEDEPSPQIIETEPKPTPTPVPFSMKPQATEFNYIDPDEVDISIYSGSIVVGDTIYASQGFSQDASEDYISFVNSFADRCRAKGINVYNVIAPTSVGVLLPAEVREQLNCADQEKVLEYISSYYDDNVRAVDTYSYISSHKNEYIYYHTDHHWTGLGAYYAYLAFCDSASLYPISLDKYEALDQGVFVGSFVATANVFGRVKTDTVTAYNPPGNIRMAVSGDGYNWEDRSVVMDKTNDIPSNRYNAYIGGDNMLTVITNDDLPDGPDCLVIKDSFGNPFSVYLSQHYHKVYVIDYRKVDDSALDYATRFGVDDVIICQSIGVSQSRAANGLLGQVLR